MRKKLIVILFAIIASVCVVLGMSACGENGGNKGQTDSDTDILQSDGTLLYELSSDGTYYIVYDVSSRDVTDIVIPATYNSLPVASIREYAFAKCTLLESITIPDSITNIGYAAFTDCSSLTSIVIPNGVSSIRESTFSGCTSLESIVIPDSVSSIQSRAFDDCTNITTATMPLYALNYMSENDLQTVIITSGDSISSDTFRWFPSLKNLTITGSVASISEDAFREYTLLENVLISGSVTSIGSGAFSLCSSLKNVTITGNVSSIGRGAFSDCTSLKNLTVGENVTSIGEVAFWNCDALEGVYITNLDAWYKIDFGGFSSNPLEYAGNLYLDGKLVTELTIPVSLTDIKDYTFAGCSSLTNVTIPNNVINIGDFAFSSCSSITNIIIPDSVTDIGDSSFSGCTSINSITVPDSVTSLGRYVFLGCTNIATATIPAHVIDDVPKDSLKTVIITSGESIERNAFANCNSLESITIPDSVTDINDAAFSGCTSLANVYITDLAAWCQIKFSSYSYTNPLCYAENFYLNGELVLDLVIPKGITSINSYAFDGYASLKSLTIPDSVNSIGSNAFRGCVNIIEARMPALAIDKIPQDSLHIVTITGGEIGKEAFKDCASLESIQVGDGVTFMDKSAFANCNSLESVHIADMAAWCNIGFYDYASNPLYYANKLYLNGELVTELVVPEGVTSLNRYVFSGCNSFVSITIPDSVTSIDSSAFYGCSNITSATMPSLAIGYIPQNNLQTVVITSGDYISDKAFYNCASLKSITISDSITSIGKDAFSGCNAELFNSYGNMYYLGNEANPYMVLVSVIPNSESIIIHDDMKLVCPEAFDDCIIKDVTMPAKAIEYVPQGNLEQVTITKGVIEEYAFEYCRSIKKLTLGDGVTSVEACAFLTYAAYDDFNSNPPLFDLTLSKSVEKIDEYAFTVRVSDGNNVYVNRLKNIHFEGNLSDWLKIDGLENLIYSSRIQGGKVCKAANVLFNGNELEGELVIPEGVTNIQAHAFDCFDKITEVVIPDTVKTIGEYAFYGCTSLANIAIGNSMTSVGENAFEKCDSLASICFEDITSWCGIDGTNNIDNSKVYIGDRKLYEITNIVIPDGVTSIGRKAFFGCSSLTSITIPDSVTSIGSYAFSGCSNLTSMVIPDSVTSIGYSAFSDCSSLESITIPFVGTTLNGTEDTHFGCIFGAPSYSNNSDYVPASLKDVILTGGDSIGDYAFEDCSSLTSMVIPDSVTSIGTRAFYGCNNLEGVYITDITMWCAIDFYDYYSNPLYYAGNLYLDGELVTELVIPDGVTSIDDSAFSGGGSFTSIVIPDSVTSIGNSAFYNCSSLTNMVIPDSVTSIGSSAFRGCSSLTNIVIPDGVTSIGDYVFYNCSSLTNMVIPDGVTSIGNSAFYNCCSLEGIYITDIAAWCAIDLYDYYSNPLYYAGNLYIDGELVTELVIPNSVMGISDYAFYGCSSLTSINIPDGVTSIGNSVFSGCSNLISIVIPDSVTSIGSYAFSGTGYCIDEANWEGEVLYIGNYLIVAKTSISGNYTVKEGTTTIVDSAFEDCSSLASIVIPDSVTSIGNSAFENCRGLTNMVIPDGVTSIGSSAFYNCISLTNMVIPDSVTSIGNFAFRGCGNLTSIVIPDSVTSIGKSAFSGCSILESVTIPFVGATLNGTEDTHFGYIFGAPSYSSNYNYVPASLKEVIITGGNSIGSSAFRGCSSLTNIVIPDGVTSIGDYVFYNCSSLTSIVIPDGVTSIGNSVFSGCSNLISIVIPDSVTSIGNSAFENCNSLTSIVIPNGVTSIGSYAFKYCGSLTNIVIPDSVTSIGIWAFEQCNNLEGVYITDIVAWCAIDFDGSNANPLSYAGNLHLNGHLVTDLVIPEGVTSIGNYAFYNCSSLTSITIPDSVRSIGVSAFEDCNSLTGITIPDGVTSIGNSAFRRCYSLTSIVIPDSVMSIGYSAFYNCNSLTSIVIPDSVMSIYYSAFYGCTSLEVIYYYGTESDWAKISIGNNNDDLTAATRYHYSETQPTEDGNFWHYAEDGVTPVIWTKETDES